MRKIFHLILGQPSTGGRVKNWSFEGSNDDISYTTLGSGVNDQYRGWKYYPINNSNNYKYLFLQIWFFILTHPLFYLVRSSKDKIVDKIPEN